MIEKSLWFQRKISELVILKLVQRL
jgi:hypothetical protein